MYKFTDVEMKNFEVDLTAIEGNVRLYVNPGFLPKDPKKAMFSLESKGNKRITIPKWQFQAMQAKKMVSKASKG